MYFKNICKKKPKKKQNMYVADIFKSFDMCLRIRTKYTNCIEGIDSIAKDFIRVKTEQAL